MINICKTIEATQANNLARSYSPLLYMKKLRELLESVVTDADFSHHDKYDLHQVVNNLLTVNYQGEEIIKYQIAKKYLFKDNTAAFEVKVGKSRADFASINGVSRCYEIKTKLDNLSKLVKQAEDYSSVFEYNTVILDKRHLAQALKDLPNEFGIMLIEKRGLKHFRRAIKNTNICSRCQLEMFTANELRTFFGPTNGNVKFILNTHTASQINTIFKQALKRRYKSRWDFVRANHETILPIDFQFFFSTKESPSLLYQRNF